MIPLISSSSSSLSASLEKNVVASGSLLCKLLNSNWNISKIIYVILFLTLFLDQTQAIKCYQCHVGVHVYFVENATRQPPLCSKFDGSDSYVVDCPFSTMCLKKVHKYVLNDDGDTIETVLRDCASQKYRDQVYKQGGWHEEHRIEEPYEEGCQESPPSEKATRSTYCHCRGNLCNSATKESNGLHTDAMAVIFVYNALKYLNSGLARY